MKNTIKESPTCKESPTWVEARFVCRINRFSAQVCLANEIEPILVHVANTARLKELLIPGVAVLLTHEPRESRKTHYTLRKVALGDLWVSIDSNSPNVLVKRWIEAGIWMVPGLPVVPGIPAGPRVQSEVTWGHSRFDLMLPEHNMMIEVKGVTLVNQGVAMFPDAPTQRGTKHLYELVDYVSQGGRAAVVFVCQRGDVEHFKPYTENDPKFSEALAAAHRAGVGIYVLRCRVTPTGDDFDGEVAWSLE